MNFRDLPRARNSVRVSYAGLSAVVPSWPAVITIQYDVTQGEGEMHFTRYKRRIYAYDPLHYTKRHEALNLVEPILRCPDGSFEYGDYAAELTADLLFPVQLMELVL